MIKKNIKNDELSSSLKNNLKLRKKQILDRDKKKLLVKEQKKLVFHG